MIISNREMWGMLFWALGNAAPRNGVAGAKIIRPVIPRRRACDKFCPGTAAKWCVCGYAKAAHSREARAAKYCSQCGQETEFAVSHCMDHRKRSA